MRSARTLLAIAACAFAAFVAVGCSGDDEPAASERPGDPEVTGEGGEGAEPGSLDWIDVPTVAATLSGPDGELIEWCLLLAATGEHRRRGLMDAPDAEMGGYDGMVFTWDDPTTGAFHMLDTEVPLSIAFFDEDGAFVSAADMDPCPPGTERCPTFGAAGPYRSAVEVPMGELDRQGIGTGWLFETGEACAPAS